MTRRPSLLVSCQPALGGFGYGLTLSRPSFPDEDPVVGMGPVPYSLEGDGPMPKPRMVKLGGRGGLLKDLKASLLTRSASTNSISL